MDEPNSDAGNTPDNNYVGRPVGTLDMNQETELPVLTVTPGDEKKYLFYKHKMVARFEIPRYLDDRTPNPAGNFAFKNHVCRVALEDEDEFIQAVQGLHQSDSLNIVRLLNIQNEAPVVNRSTVRGPASTSTIPGGADARPAVDAVPAQTQRKPGLNLGGRTLVS